MDFIFYYYFKPLATKNSSTSKSRAMDLILYSRFESIIIIWWWKTNPHVSVEQYDDKNYFNFFFLSVTMWKNKITLFKDIVKVQSYGVFLISALTLTAMQTLDELSNSNRKSFMNLDFKKKLLSLYFFFKTFSLPMILVSLIYFENVLINIIPTGIFNRKKFFKNSNHF